MPRDPFQGGRTARAAPRSDPGRTRGSAATPGRPSTALPSTGRVRHAIRAGGATQWRHERSGHRPAGALGDFLREPPGPAEPRGRGNRVLRRPPRPRACAGRSSPSSPASAPPTTPAWSRGRAPTPPRPSSTRSPARWPRRGRAHPPARPGATRCRTKRRAPRAAGHRPPRHRAPDRRDGRRPRRHHGPPHARSWPGTGSATRCWPGTTTSTRPSRPADRPNLTRMLFLDPPHPRAVRPLGRGGRPRRRLAPPGRRPLPRRPGTGRPGRRADPQERRLRVPVVQAPGPQLPVRAEAVPPPRGRRLRARVRGPSAARRHRAPDPDLHRRSRHALRADTAAPRRRLEARPAMPVDWKTVSRGRVRVDSVPGAVTPREEVRPMNAVRTWVLPLVVTVGRLT